MKPVHYGCARCGRLTTRRPVALVDIDTGASLAGSLCPACWKAAWPKAVEEGRMSLSAALVEEQVMKGELERGGSL